MLQLLSPLALFALISLALPALLHLWRPPASTVRVGTLRFFTGPAIRRLTKLQWRERVLLLVRLLLLATLVLLLARPFWLNRPATTAQSWALIDDAVALEGQALKRWRELESAGFEMRQFAHGFPKVALPKRRGGRASERPDVWSYLREADAILPTGSKIAVFSSEEVNSLRGERPALARVTVEWISVPPNERETHSWIASAVVADDSAEIRAVIATSSATETRHTLVKVPAAAGTHALSGPLQHLAFEVRRDESNRFSARLLNTGDGSPISTWMPAARAEPLVVDIIHSADRAEDARYLQAAIQAFGGVSGRSTKVNVAGVEGSRADGAGGDWIFWLSDDPVPAQLESRATHLVSDAENSRDAALLAPSRSIVSGSGVWAQDPLQLLRRVMLPPTGTPVWRDSSGEPLLTVERLERGRHWRFGSRFHPAWNDLPRSSALPAALAALLSDARNESHVSPQDRRRADPSQGPPEQLAASSRISEPALPSVAERVDLHHLFWIVAVVLFGLERALSHRRAPAIASERSRAAPVLAEHA